MAASSDTPARTSSIGPSHNHIPTTTMNFLGSVVAFCKANPRV